MNSKYIFFIVVILVTVASDQVTKLWSESRLASTSPPVGEPHYFDVEVPASVKGQTIEAFLIDDLSWTPENEVKGIARSRTLLDGKRVTGQEKLEGGEVLTVTSRKIEVVKDFFHFRYTRNPGAAFGFLSKEHSEWRRPFFLIVSVLAIVVILLIFRKVTTDQKLLMWALSLIVGGAIGNFIDRIAYGWVIDFIDWHYYREFTWPTFNLADSYITIGVILMALDIIVNKHDEEGENQLPPAS
jgi:lipoprotein signal peptidase